MLRKTFKWLAWIVAIFLLTIVVLVIYVRTVATVQPPVPESLQALNKPVIEVDTGLFKIDNNWFRKSESGLYELYVEGEPFERGAANGRLTRELVEHQEVGFYGTDSPVGTFRILFRNCSSILLVGSIATYRIM